MINSIPDAIGWVHTVLASDPRLAKYVQEITSTPSYGPFTEARILQTYFNFGGASWPTDDATLLRWGHEIMAQLQATGLLHLRGCVCNHYGQISVEKIRTIMRATRAMLFYLAESPGLIFNENMRFYMVTAQNRPLPRAWVDTPPGGIVTVERMLSVDTPDIDGFLKPWGDIDPISMPIFANKYHLAIIKPAPGNRTRLRPSPVIDDPRFSGCHNFKAPPGTQFTVVRVEPNHWVYEPRVDHPETDIFTHIILEEVPNQPAYVVPDCIRRAGM